jgi:hypothetical protein
MKGYSIVDNEIIEPHVKFLRINPTDIKLTLKNVLDSLMNLSWLSNFDEDYLVDSYRLRCEQSIKHIATNIIKQNDSSVTRSSGEYVVSELARSSVVDTHSYLDIPIADLFKKQTVGNPGFDFYTLNSNKNILFGEAKYITKQSGHLSALKQSYNFYTQKQHITEIADIRDFFCKDSLKNCNKDEIGFMVAFSAKKTTTANFVKIIKKNPNYQELIKFKEVILIAVNI